MSSRKRCRRASSPASSIDVTGFGSTSSSPPPADIDDPCSKRAKFEKRYDIATLSNEDILNKQMQTWTSDVYQHFRPPVIGEERGMRGEVTYVFTCKKSPSIKVTRVRHDDSTSNLMRHMRNCNGVAAGSASLKDFAHGSTYTPHLFRMKLSLWVSRRHRPFAIVEDEELVDIFKDLNNKVEVPSRFTVSRDVKEIFEMSRKQVATMLKAYPGKLHLCADGWTSPNVISFVGLTVHWAGDGQIHSTILDFVKASKGHTGSYLAARISECLHEYEIQDKILAFTTDNASNNNTLINELGDLLPGFQGSLTRVRCFAHILNLVVKSILSQFSHKPVASEDAAEVARDAAAFNNLDDDPDEDETLENDEDEVADDELEPSVAASDAAIVDEVAAEAEEDPDVPILSRAEVNLGKFAVTKLRNLAKRIFHSPTLRADLKAHCENLKIPPVLMIRDVATRWNSTAQLLERALNLREPLNRLVTSELHNKARSARLKRFLLTKQEWDLLDKLFPLLEVFLLATEQISQSKTPLVHEVIPVFDLISRALDEHVADATLPSVVRVAAARGRTMLNKYYGLTDDSIIFRIAMLLHPQYKGTYFQLAKWPREWVTTAERILRDEWNSNYKPADAPVKTTSVASSSSKRNKYFESFNALNVVSTGDAIDEWLNTPPISNVSNGLQYWSAMAASGHPLAAMAKDFLSIPATSTDAERAFSRGGLTVSKMRHSLSDSSTRAATVLGAWCSLPGAIPRDEVLTVFRDKGKRPKGNSTNTLTETAIAVD